MKTILKVVPLAAALALSGMASAADFEKQVEGRQAYMEVLGYNMGILGAMARGKMDYDADLASAAANNLKYAAMMNNASMWPAGSDMDALGDETEAKADLWKNFSQAAGYLDDLKKGSETLASAAGNGLGELRKNIGAVGDACGGCHKKFKED
ncbi:c-type cytochrome [Gynuella sp.]|uniref:c-type cytochrome n=1 Tax=Gynuella sp. TaxID=2969146 RepID=UPI003D0B1BE3